MDGRLGENELAPRLVGNVIYVHYTQLHQWEENKEARILHEKDWRRLLSSIIDRGIKDELTVGNDGTIYDGNHRWEAVKQLIEQGRERSDNMTDLAWLPCKVSNPQTDTEKLSLVLNGNDKDFAIYNKEWIMNNQERLQQVPGFDDISVDVEEPMTLGEAYDWPDDEEDPAESDDSEESGEPENPKASNLMTKEVTCPNCAHTFVFNP